MADQGPYAKVPFINNQAISKSTATTSLETASFPEKIPTVSELPSVEIHALNQVANLHVAQLQSSAFSITKFCSHAAEIRVYKQEEEDGG